MFAADAPDVVAGRAEEEGSDLRAISCETALLETAAPLQLVQAAPLAAATPERRHGSSLSNRSQQRIPQIEAAHKGTNRVGVWGSMRSTWTVWMAAGGL